MNPSVLSFRKKSVVKKVMDKRGGRQYQDFPSKIFCLRVPKKLVREPFSVSLISGMEKNFASEGYVTIFDFLSNFFCLTVPKKLLGEPSVLCFKKIPVLKKLMEERGGSIMIFRRSLLV